jgi:hypothetical protein
MIMQERDSTFDSIYDYLWGWESLCVSLYLKKIEKKKRDAGV